MPDPSTVQRTSCILSNLECILDALQEYADSAPADSAAKAQGFAKFIGHGNFLVSLKCAVAVLNHLENLNRAVQSSSKSVASIVTAMKMTVGALNDLRDEDRFQALFEEAVMLCRESDVPFPELPRQRRPPKRFCGPAPAHTWTTAEEYFRNQYFKVVNTAVSQLKLRYDQPGLHRYMQLENVLIAADTSTDELRTVISAYPEMDADRLAVQLDNRTGNSSRWRTSLQSSHQLNQLFAVCLTRLSS